MKLLHKVLLLFTLLAIIPALTVVARVILLTREELLQILPYSQVQAIITQIARESVVYLIYIVVVVVIVAIFFTGSIVSPVTRLNTAVKKISSGEYSYRVEVDSTQEFRELAEALNKMASELERVIKRLEEENRKRKVYIDVLVHDLSNFVSIIDGFATILLEEDGKEEFRIIKRNCDRIKEIIDNSTVLSKLEDMEESRAEISIRKMIDKILADFSPNLNNKKVDISGDAIVTASPIIEQVFSNLISNAIKYGKNRIKIGIEEANNTVRVYVEDDGGGVPDEYKTAIFERFERGEKKGVRGTGLGLAIVKAIVDMHHGRVWVEDSPLGGARFIVELPKREK